MKHEGDAVEVLIALYDTQEACGHALTEQAALKLFEHLKEQVAQQADVPGVEGYFFDAVRLAPGKIYATLRLRTD